MCCRNDRAVVDCCAGQRRVTDCQAANQVFHAVITTTTSLIMGDLTYQQSCGSVDAGDGSYNTISSRLAGGAHLMPL